MKALVTTFFRGLSVVLPVVLTVWFVVWLATSAEALLRHVFLWFLPEDLYLPGLGMALGIAIIFAAGLLARVFLLRQVWGLLEALFERIPVIKTVYNAISDFVDFFSTSDIDEEASRVVTIDMGNGIHMVGLVTDTEPQFGVGNNEDDDGTIGVYLPMSYNVGGYTLLVPKSRVRDSDMSVEAAMRWAMTAGIQKR